MEIGILQTAVPGTVSDWVFVGNSVWRPMYVSSSSEVTAAYKYMLMTADCCLFQKYLQSTDHPLLSVACLAEGKHDKQIRLALSA